MCLLVDVQQWQELPRHPDLQLIEQYTAVVLGYCNTPSCTPSALVTNNKRNCP